MKAKMAILGRFEMGSCYWVLANFIGEAFTDPEAETSPAFHLPPSNTPPSGGRWGILPPAAALQPSLPLS